MMIPPKAISIGSDEHLLIFVNILISQSLLNYKCIELHVIFILMDSSFRIEI